MYELLIELKCSFSVLFLLHPVIVRSKIGIKIMTDMKAE